MGTNCWWKLARWRYADPTSPSISGEKVWRGRGSKQRNILVSPFTLPTHSFPYQWHRRLPAFRSHQGTRWLGRWVHRCTSLKITSEVCLQIVEAGPLAPKEYAVGKRVCVENHFYCGSCYQCTHGEPWVSFITMRTSEIVRLETSCALT